MKKRFVSMFLAAVMAGTMVAAVPVMAEEATEAAEIAENAENIDAVIAAHNHKFVDGIVNGIPVVQAGYNGRGLSVISFTLDENNNIVQSEGNT